MKWTALSIAAIGVILPVSLSAQHARYEVGLRVRAFERAFAKKLDDVAARRRVLPSLEAAVRGFFSANLASVAASMDTARARLAGDSEVDGRRRFAESLELLPTTRCVDLASEKPVEVRVRTLYRVDESAGKDVVLDWELAAKSGRVMCSDKGVSLAELPIRLVVSREDLTAGDHTLRFSFRSGADVVARREMPIACLEKARERLGALRAFARSADATSMERATLVELVRLLRISVLGRSLETDIEAWSMMREAEALQRWLQADDRAPWFSAARRSSFVGFPGRTRGRTGVVPARLFVPEPAAGDKTAKPRPLVIALAGAGASANMWFDSYGAGAIVDACRKRGWICVARASAGFDPVTNVDAMMRSIAKRWPVDANRVYLVGHSMGAMKACETAARMPAKFRAVVALGGGGTTGRGEVFRKIAFYVAPGDRDFALAGARALARALERLEQPEIRYRVFEACEHFGIVQVALPNAFRWLDSLE